MAEKGDMDTTERAKRKVNRETLEVPAKSGLGRWHTRTQSSALAQSTCEKFVKVLRVCKRMSEGTLRFTASAECMQSADELFVPYNGFQR